MLQPLAWTKTFLFYNNKTRSKDKKEQQNNQH